MSEHLPVPAAERTHDYYQSPEYFRSLDVPLDSETVEQRRRLYEPVRYAENGRRRIPIERQYSQLYKTIFESSLGDAAQELQTLRQLSADYVMRSVHLVDDASGDAARHALLSELCAELPVYGEQGIEGLQRYEYAGGPVTLMLDGMPIEDVADVYKEIVPAVIRPSDREWRRVAVDMPSPSTVPIEQYDLTPTVTPSVEAPADDEPMLEGNDDVIGYETFHQAKLATLRFGVRALAVVTGQIEKIEHLLKTAA